MQSKTRCALIQVYSLDLPSVHGSAQSSLIQTQHAFYSNQFLLLAALIVQDPVLLHAFALALYPVKSPALQPTQL